MRAVTSYALGRNIKLELYFSLTEIDTPIACRHFRLISIGQEMEEETQDKVLSMRQAGWFFRQALAAASSLKKRQELCMMLLQEIATLDRQIFEQGLQHMPYDQVPSMVTRDKEEALDLGLKLCEHMDFLRQYIRRATRDRDGEETWPWRVYDKATIWPEEFGSAQQMTMPGMEKVMGLEPFERSCELPVFRVVDGEPK